MSSARLYSAEQVAELLGLHVRTVRTYVRDGRLAAVRIGKQYRIAHDDVVEFTGGRLAAADATTVAIEVSSVVRIDGVDADTMARIDALLGGDPPRTGRDRTPLHVQTIYDREQRSAKVVVLGTADDTATVLGLLAAFDGGPR